MKKRVLSLFLSICTIASMFAGMSFGVSAATVTTSDINEKYPNTVKLSANATMDFYAALSNTDKFPSALDGLTPLAASATVSSVYENKVVHTDTDTVANRMIDGNGASDVTASSISAKGDQTVATRFEEQEDKYIQIIEPLKSSAEISKIFIGASEYAMGHYRVYAGNSVNTIFDESNLVADFKASNIVNENRTTAYSKDMRAQIITLTEPVSAKYIALKVLDTHYLALDCATDTTEYSGTYPTKYEMSDMTANTSSYHGHHYLRLREFNAYGTCNADVVAVSRKGANPSDMGITNPSVVIGHAEIARWKKSKDDDKYYLEQHAALTDVQQECWVNGVSERTADAASVAADGKTLTEYPIGGNLGNIIKQNPDDPYEGWDGYYYTVLYKLSDLNGNLADVSDIFINLGAAGANHLTTVFGVYVAKGGLTTVFNDDNLIYYQDEFTQTAATAATYGNNLHIQLSGDAGKNTTYVGVKVYRTVNSLADPSPGVNLRWGEFNVYGTRQNTADYTVVGKAAGTESTALPADFTEKDENNLVSGKDLTYVTNVNGVYGEAHSQGVTTFKEDGNFSAELNMSYGGNNALTEMGKTGWNNLNFPDDESKFYQEIYMPLDKTASISKVTHVSNKTGNNDIYNTATQTDVASSMWVPEHLKVIFYPTLADAKAGTNAIKTCDIKENDYGYLQLILDKPVTAGCVVIRYIVPFQRSKYAAYTTTNALYNATTYYQRVHYVGVYGEYENGGVDANSVTASATGCTTVAKPTVTFTSSGVPDKNGKYAAADYTLTAADAPESYEFEGWFKGDDLVSSDLTFTLKNVTSAASYTAVYDLYAPKFTVMVKDPAGKVISTQVVKENQALSDKQIATIKAAIAEKASDIYGYEINVDQDGNYVFNDSLSAVVTANRTVVLTYVRKKDAKTITFQDADGNTIGTETMLFDKEINFAKHNSAAKWIINGTVVDVTKTKIYVTGDMTFKIAKNTDASANIAVIASAVNGTDNVLFAYATAQESATVSQTGIIFVTELTSETVKAQEKDLYAFALDENTAKYAKIAYFQDKVDNFMVTYKGGESGKTYIATAFIKYSDGSVEYSADFKIVK